MTARPPDGVGEALARLYRQCWRSDPPLLAETPDAELCERVIAMGGAGLVARRLVSPPESLLRVAALERLRARAQVEHFRAAVSAFRAGGIEPILIKGLSLGRLYPEAELRPSGDLDFWVDPDQFSAAHSVAAGLGLTTPIDLHPAPHDRCYHLGWPEIRRHAAMTEIGGIAVMTLDRAHELRLLVLHFLRHGGWRPLWLCDIGSALEASGAQIDWGRAFGPNPFTRGWVTAGLALAVELLGAAPPIGLPDLAGPDWPRTVVMAQWGKGPGLSQGSPLAVELRTRPVFVWPGVLAGHWRNPLQACLETGTPPREGRQLRAQIEAFVRRIPGFSSGHREAPVDPGGNMD